MEVPVKGFGSSDCSGGCIAHLHYFPSHFLEQIVSYSLKSMGRSLITRKIYICYTYRDLKGDLMLKK